MIAEQSNITRDSMILEGYGMNDLDTGTLKRYRQRFSVLKPESDWNTLDNKEFLKRIGGWDRNRKTNLEGLTVAGLLIFGEERHIMSYLPSYFLDYREKLSNIPDQRWSDRITSQDGTWSGNLFDFYSKVIKKVNDDVKVPFMLEGDELSRQIDTRVHKALREAVLNTIIHADYFTRGNIVIEKKHHLYRFSNPGVLLIPYDRAIEGGTSEARNKFIFKIFAQLGFGEQSGYGLEHIHKTWREQHWRKPALVEEFGPDRTTLQLHTVSLLPDEIVDFLQSKLSDRYHQLIPDEVITLATVCVEKFVTNTRIQELINKNSLQVNKILVNLVEEKLLTAKGQGRGTKYILGEIFYSGELPIERYILPDESVTMIEGNTAVTDEKGKMIGGNGATTNESGELTGGNDITTDESEEMIGGNGVTTDESEEMIGDNDRLSLYAELREVSQITLERKRLPPELLIELILELCKDQFLSLSELSMLLNRDESHLRKSYIHDLIKEKNLNFAIRM